MDKALRKQLEDHLAPLKRQGIIRGWHDRLIGAGQEWKGNIDKHLEESSIILLLISANFLASDYCYDVEMKRAKEKHEAGEARVIPIILRAVDWSEAPFSKLQALPENGKPITRWSNRDEGWKDVANGIRKACKELRGKVLIALSSDVLINLLQKRNPFFTGREQILDRLRAVLIAEGAVALSGLGGIGKTQTAVEYAYQYRDEYKELLWVKADQREALVSGFVTIATLLNLHGKDDQDQTLTVSAVKTWLEGNTGWLLILDNADDLAMASEFIPLRGKGHVLLTTQAQATGSIAPCIAIKNMEFQEGALFLLRRAKLLTQDAALDQASEAERAQAEEISKEMGGLPLALDQAGAYIEESGCSLRNYLGLYRTHGVKLLKRRGIIVSTHEHPEPVATTWALSFEKVEKHNPAAAELLRFCAFLNPDAIPEELLTQGAAKHGPVLKHVASDPFELNNAIADLLKYSLLRRDPDAKLLDIHRLVQATLKDGMNEAAQRRWAKRAVRVVNRVFPDGKISNWPRCERVLPHAQVCAELIERWDLDFLEAALLLKQAGSYLHDRGRYGEAEPLYRRSLAISEKVLGSEHPDVAGTLNLLAVLYRSQGRYVEAEPLHQRALAIREKALGPEHPDVADSLNNLGGVYYSQDRYVEAEPLYQRALAIREKALGPEHPHVAGTLNNLGGIYNSQDRHAEAEPLFQRALAIQQKALGPEHPDMASSLRNLAALYHIQGRYGEAEPLYRRALAIREKVLGPDHPDVAGIINILALFYLAQDRYDEAEPLCRRALGIPEEALGPEHRDMASILEKLVGLHRRLNLALKAANMEADDKAIFGMNSRKNPTN
jgi:tetratricopeptide (TPR) repeat protein